MQRNRRVIIGLLLTAIVMAGCNETTFQSSVPAYPVRVVIDTRMGEFVHFQPTAINTYVIVTREGYFYNGKMVLPRPVTDGFGYGGVVVFVNILSDYSAYDMACPFCAQKRKCVPCIVDGIYATCPECGEEYDLSSGVANPIHGIAHESLRQLNIAGKETGRLVITQKQ